MSLKPIARGRSRFNRRGGGLEETAFTDLRQEPIFSGVAGTSLTTSCVTAAQAVTQCFIAQVRSCGHASLGEQSPGGGGTRHLLTLAVRHPSLIARLPPYGGHLDQYPLRETDVVVPNGSLFYRTRSFIIVAS